MATYSSNTTIKIKSTGKIEGIGSSFVIPSGCYAKATITAPTGPAINHNGNSLNGISAGLHNIVFPVGAVELNTANVTILYVIFENTPL